eukprot:Platyproteum_vivax@DN6192_c0_g1_i1.p1
MAFRISRILRAAEAGKQMMLTLASPSEAIFNKVLVDAVTVPGAEGYFTISNSHVQTVSRLRPGLITVKVNATDTKKYFVSDGFVVNRPPSDIEGCFETDVVGVEVVPVEALDKDRAVQVLSDLLSGPKDSEWDKVRVQLGQELLSEVIRHAGATQ